MPTTINRRQDGHHYADGAYPTAGVVIVNERYYRPPGLYSQTGTSSTVSQSAGLLWVVPFRNEVPIVMTAIGTDIPTAGGLGKYCAFVVYRMLKTGEPGPVYFQTADVSQGASASTPEISCRVYLPVCDWGLGIVTDASSGTFTGMDKNGMRRLGFSSITDSPAACHIRYSTSWTGGSGYDLAYPSSPAYRSQDPPLITIKAATVQGGL